MRRLSLLWCILFAMRAFLYRHICVITFILCFFSHLKEHSSILIQNLLALYVFILVFELEVDKHSVPRDIVKAREMVTDFGPRSWNVPLIMQL